jgi:hypothetical protein
LVCSRVGWYEGRRARCGWSRGAVRASILLDRVFVERQVAVFLHTHIHVGPLGPQMGLRVSRETFARTLSVIFLHSCAKVAWRYGCRFGGVGRPCLALCVWGEGTRLWCWFTVETLRPRPPHPHNEESHHLVGDDFGIVVRAHVLVHALCDLQPRARI